MIKKRKIILMSVAAVFIGTLIFFWLDGKNFAVLEPKGTIAEQQLTLIIHATLLMLIVVLPVFILTFFIAWKYRESNSKAKYSPDWDSNRMAEASWWFIPLAIIIALSVTIWRSSQALDPFKPLVSNKKPVTVQVVALEWKWLFIYPEEGIATVNQLQIPKDTPVNFEITSDAPMNSFWIPQLGGQVYAMAGMTTKLHLEGTEIGEYTGSSANLSGEGFAGMKFVTRVSSKTDFDSWVSSKKLSSERLTFDKYKILSEPSKNVPPNSFVEDDQSLYAKIINKYMEPGQQEKRPAEHYENEASHH